MKVTRIPSQAGLKPAELFIFVVIISLLAVIASPNFVSAWNTVPAKTGVTNPSEIDAITARFALEINKPAGCLINYPNDLTSCSRLSLAGGLPGFTAGDIYGKGIVNAQPTGLLGDLTTASPLLP